MIQHKHQIVAQKDGDTITKATLLVNVPVGLDIPKMEVLALGIQTVGEYLLTDMCGLNNGCYRFS